MTGFTPLTVNEMYDAFTVARDDASIGVIILTGANHGGRHEDEAFCSGGDQKIRGNGGYVGEDNIPRLNVLDLQRLIRVVPKPVIAMVNGYAIGGGGNFGNWVKSGTRFSLKASRPSFASSEV